MKVKRFIYRQKYRKSISNIIHVKCEGSCIHCLNDSGKVKNFRQFYNMTYSCKNKFLFYTKKAKLIRFSENMIKTTLLSWQICFQKYPKEVRRWEKRWQNLCRNYLDLHDTNLFYPGNTASKPWQMNIHLIESSIHYLKWSIHFQN